MGPAQNLAGKVYRLEVAHNNPRRIARMLDKGLDKAQWLEEIRSVRTGWENLLNEIRPERLLEPGAEGSWSVKDVLAHITYWDEVAARYLEGALKGERPAKSKYSGLDTDEYNEALYQDNKDRSLDDLLQWSARTHERVISAVEQLSEEDLANANLYPWLNGTPLREIVEGNGYGHMSEHTNDVRAWLEGKATDQATV